jgi:8-oxo-dGTP pyrophosphatase MutT (NUDIX family)
VIAETAQAPSALDADSLRAKLGGFAGPRRLRGDHDLNPGMNPPARLTPAAVLVPLLAKGEDFAVLLTQRTAHLAAHAGQISFPGGRLEPGDADALAAALRETEEEIGLARHFVEPIATLDLYTTRSGFEVTPIVGLVTPGYSLAPDPYEVADVFEVPLSFFRDPANRRRESRAYEGRERHFYAFPYGERYIWGATAGMLVNLLDWLG